VRKARPALDRGYSLIGRHPGRIPTWPGGSSLSGHAICGHTMTHPLTFARGAPAEIRRQVVDAQSAIVDATGAAPRLFRGPGGAWSPTVLQTAAGNGMVPIDWKAEPRTGPAPAPPISSVACWPPGRATSGSATMVVAIGRTPCRYSGKVLPVLVRRGRTFVVPL